MLKLAFAHLHYKTVRQKVVDKKVSLWHNSFSKRKKTVDNML